MTDTKLSLSIILPGSVMYSEAEASKQLTKPVKNKAGKTIKKKGVTLEEVVSVPDFDKHDVTSLKLLGDVKATKVFTRKAKPAKQVINMSKEAYSYMISDECPPEFKGVWKTLSAHQKILWHCQRIAETLGGVVESYKVLD